jgi:TP901 family phage tail tape measure protein
MALGFNYTLSVDEDNSLRSLTKFLEKVEGQKVVLGLDFDMNALSDMLKKIQTEITNASKNLTLTFGSFRIDEDELQRTLKQAGQNTKVAANVSVNVDEGDLKGISQAFSDVPITLEREINKIKDSLTVSLNNLAQSAKNNGLQNLIPIDEIERSIKELHTTGNSLGEIRKEASFVRQEISSWSQVAKGQAAMFRTTATEAGTVADSVSSINKSMETTAIERYRRQLQLNLDTQLDNIKYSKEFVKLTESQKNSFNQLASAANLTETSMRGLKDEYANLNLRIKEFKQHDIAPVIRDQQKSFSGLFSTIGKGAFYFNEIGDALGITSVRLGDAVQHIRDVDEAFINIRRTMGTSKEQFNGMVDVASDIAYANGIAIDSVLEMVKIYGNAGTTMEQMQAKLSVAAQFQSISGQDAQQVTTSMQAIMNQFKMAQGSADEAAASMRHLGDVMVGVGYELEKDEGLAMQDIISGVEAAGAVVNNAGGSFEWLSAVVATLSEQMNATGDETGNAMKMIAARTLQSKEAIEELAAAGEDMTDIEVKASNAEKALGEIGVSVRESNGEFKDLEDILGEVADKWDTLNNTQKQMVSEQLAGNNRRNYFIAMMEDYERVIELTDKAKNSQGAMTEASERQSESLEIAINRLINSFKELYRSLMDSDGLKAFVKTLDLVVRGLTKLNDFLGGGLMPTLGMVTGAFLALRIEMSALTGQGLIGGAISLFKQLGTALAGLAAKAGLARMAMGGLIGLIAGVAIAGIGKLISHFKETAYSAEKTINSLDALGEELVSYKQTAAQLEQQSLGLDELEESVEKLKGLNGSTQEYKDLQEDVNQKISEFAQLYPDLAPTLENENIALDEKIKKMQEYIDLKKEEMNLETLSSMGGTDGIQRMADEMAKYAELKQLYSNAMSQAHMAGVDSTGLDANGNVWKTTINGVTLTYEALQEAIASVNSEIVMSETQFNNVMSTLGQLVEEGQMTEEQFNNIKDSLYELAMAQGWDIGAIESMIENMGLAEEETEELGDEAEVTKKKIERLNETMNKTINDSGDINDQYVQTLSYLEEAAELLAGLDDGLDLSDLQALSDSDIMADFTGSIDNAAQVTEHLKNKMQELQDKAYETSINMALQNEDTWNQIATQVADSLGIQEEDMATFINSIGDMREIDVENAQSAADAQQQAEMDMVRNGAMGYANFVNSKAGNRQVDMKNVAGFLNQQEVQEADTVEDLKRMWAAYYNAKAETIRSELGDLSGKISAMAGDYGDMGNVDPAVMSKFHAIQKQMRELEATNDAMTNYFNNVSTTLDGASGALGQAAANASKAVGGAKNSGYKGKNASSKGGSGSKGSGSKGGSSSTEKEVEDMEKLTDRYYKFEDALRNVEKQLSKTRAERDNITTKKDYEKSINKEIDLINQQIKAMENIRKEYQKERDEIKKTLQNNGFKFDKNGDITNYQKQLDKLVNQANKISDPEKKKAMQEQVKALADLIERYNELDDETIPDTTTEITDLKNEIADLTKDLAEQTAAIEDLGDAYYNLNREISDVDNALDMNAARQEHARGQDQIDLLEEQIGLLKQKQDLNKQQQANAKNDAEDLKKQLSQQGVKFDKNGDITNYEALIKKLTNKANSLVGDDKDEALENIQDLIDLIDQYTTLTGETIPDLELDWQNYQNQINDVKNTLAELHQEEVEAAANAQKQVADAYEHYLTERYNKVKDALKKEQEEYNKAYEEENFERGLADEQRKLDEIAQQIAVYERDMSAAGQAKLAQLRAEYEAQRNAMNEIIRENEHENTNEDFDDQQESLDQALADALDPAKLVQVVNDAIGSGLITIGDQVVELDDLMTTWLDETGDGLYVMGDALKSELLDNLNAAKETLTEMGLTNGAGIDLFSKSSTLLNNAAGTTNSMSGSVTFGAPLLYVEGNVDSSNIDDITTELQKVEQRIYENIAKSLK